MVTPLEMTKIHCGYKRSLYGSNENNEDVVKQCGIMGFIYSIIKQPPLQIKIYLNRLTGTFVFVNFAKKC